MNVAISSIAQDLGTSVQGVQTAITLFTLVMAAFMIPGGKLTEILGRKRTFVLGLIIYGLGTLIAALAPSITILTVGYSLFEGIGTALLIPPVYILATVLTTDLKSRARAFAVISAMAGIGAAAGPLIGGIVTTTFSWRAAFLLQTLAVAAIIILSRRIVDAGITGTKPKFDFVGTILSAAGLIFIVIGILQASTYGFFVSTADFVLFDRVIIPQGGISPVWLFVGIGAVILLGFFLYINRAEKRGKEPLLSPRMFRNRTSNFGLVTQNIQWLTLQGSSFTISVFLQTVRGFTAIATGLMLTPATIGILVSSVFAGRLAQRFEQRRLIQAGFLITIAGLLLLLALASATSDLLSFVPGLFLMGAGLGVMLTSSVNVVQSAFPEEDQGEISGLSRSVSNLGSSLGTALVGAVIISVATIGNQAYANAILTMILFSAIGFVAAVMLPRTQTLKSNLEDEIQLET
jgi:MFS family permease